MLHIGFYSKYKCVLLASIEELDVDFIPPL
ncbi:hypothetical protein K530_53895 [Streptomyces noursei CCRC 11814]|nr:hypothetical protein K530_53895 [Streptomyces noursei CCRC 11814]